METIASIANIKNVEMIFFIIPSDSQKKGTSLCAEIFCNERANELNVINKEITMKRCSEPEHFGYEIGTPLDDIVRRNLLPEHHLC